MKRPFDAHTGFHSPERVEPTRAAELTQRAQGRRIGVVSAVATGLICAGLAGVFARVAQLQLDTPERLAEHMDSRTSRMTLLAPRGDIRDRRGRVLAASTTGYRLFVDPHLLLGLDTPPRADDEAAVAAHIAAGNAALREAIRELTPLAERLEAGGGAELANRLTNAAVRAHELAEEGKANRYMRVTHALGGAELAAAQRVIARLDADWLGLERVPVREAPSGEAAAAIVGFVGFDHSGLLGAESAHDAHLRAEPGFVRYVRDASGKPMWVDAGDYAMPTRGDELRLSIDLHLQQIATAELDRGIEDAGARGGRLVLVDPASGEVLAMVDRIRDDVEVVPFTTEAANAARDTGAWVRFETLVPDESRAKGAAFARNRCVEDVYEPGSTLKPFIWAAVLAHGETTPSEEFKTHNGSWRTSYGRLIEDVHEEETMSWRDVLVYSSNIGMAQGVERLSHEEARRAVLRYGFAGTTGLGLPGETAGLVTSARNWNKYTHTSIAFGYEVGVTPVLMARAFTIFAREGSFAGTMPALTLLARGHESAALRVVTRVLPSHIALETRDAMVRVAERMLENTARAYPDDRPMPYTMFGKSGTAKVARPDGRGYFEHQYNSSFVAGAPAENPRLVVLVVIDDPSPERVRSRRAYGSQVAGPVTARVLSRSLEYLGVPHDAADEIEAGDVTGSDLAIGG
jgi:cell division protein FtsI (penicillin-binding protein 3)